MRFYRAMQVHDVVQSAVLLFATLMLSVRPSVTLTYHVW